MEDKGNEIEAPPIIPPQVVSAPPRENLIVTAMKFLNNPNVVRSPISQKQSFLRSKGLTEEEIQLACDRAGVFTSDPNAKNQTIISMDVGTSSSKYPQQIAVPRQTTLGRIKDILNSVALISGLAYAVYLFYKTFIKPLIFRGKKKKSIEEQITEVNHNVEVKIEKVSADLIQIKDELTKHSQATAITKELNSFKKDLESIKGLLLNRKQFATPHLPVVPPSIPAWQLSSQQQQLSEVEIHDKGDDINDTGSGSGSSETEVVTKNSDSSLEIIS